MLEIDNGISLVKFAATWCGPCIKSFPAMQKAVDKFKNENNVAFLFINSRQSGDTDEEKTEAVTSFLEKRPFTFNVLFDRNSQVMSDYGSMGLPVKYIIDKDGNEVVNHNVIQRDRLRVDTRKWYLSKLNPKKYSDKIQVDTSEFKEQPLFNTDGE